MLDILFVHPNSSVEVYQELSREHSAIETPIWAGLLANHCRTKGFGVQILDCEAEKLGYTDAATVIKETAPRLVCFVVYGQQPSASSQNMEGAITLAKYLKAINPTCKTVFLGGHVAALPLEVLVEDCVDFVCQNEGVYTLRDLLCCDNFEDHLLLEKVKGLGWKQEGHPRLNTINQIVPQELLERDLPGIAWDLLPPASKYRTAGWHAWPNETEKAPFASLYTSLGCPHRCSFCLEENTLIITSNCRNKKIKDISKADKLLAFDINLSTIVETSIKDIISRKTDTLLKITLSDGKTIKATPEHPFFVEGKWIDAKELKINDKCLVIDSSDTICPHYVIITKIEKLKGDFTVYNFECGPYNNFFANNILTHNCMINIINRTDNSPGVASDKSAIFRHWQPEFIISEFDKIAEMGVKNVKIADELFVLRERHFMEVCRLIIERKYDFNIWCYSRIDTCKPKYLDTLKQAGVNFIALGIESPNQVVRKDVIKGGYKEVKIMDVVNSIRDAGINVCANYIFGLPLDNHETMQDTLNFAMEANTENCNLYCAQCYPGSPLYYTAKENNWTLPDRYSGYSQHSYYTQNLPTNYLTAAEVLSFRDKAWVKYFTNPTYLDMLERKFGKVARDNVEATTKINLKRRLLGD